jgi:hypothetical protein
MFASSLPTDGTLLDVPLRHQAIPLVTAAVLVIGGPLAIVVAVVYHGRFVDPAIGNAPTRAPIRFLRKLIHGSTAAVIFLAFVATAVSALVTMSPELQEWLVTGWRAALLAPTRTAFIALPAVALTMVRRLYGSQSFRRRVGIVWDIVTVWPRRYHPFAPPPYARRAVDELESRARHLNEPGTDTPFVLAGHSQGSLLCAIAAKRLDDCSQFMGLVTYGSPLATIYAPTFGPVTTALTSEIGGPTTSCAQRQWANLHRVNDPIAGPIEGCAARNSSRDLGDGGHSEYEGEQGYADAVRAIATGAQLPTASPATHS